MRLLNRFKETISDGTGIRYSIYLSGCRHACPGCHNPESWDQHNGIELNDEILKEIIQEINGNPLLDGITISGGDPFFQPEALLKLVQLLKKETKKDIWCYTGYTIEYILRDETMASILNYIDTLVDGPFIESKRDPTLSFRGSSNQRIIKIRHEQALGEQFAHLIAKKE